MKYLAIQHNDEGRPCGFGISEDIEEAKTEAAKQYDGHQCYSGEEKGEMKLHVVEPAQPCCDTCGSLEVIHMYCDGCSETP